MRTGGAWVVAGGALWIAACGSSGAFLDAPADSPGSGPGGSDGGLTSDVPSTSDAASTLDVPSTTDALPTSDAPPAASDAPPAFDAPSTFDAGGEAPGGDGEGGDAPGGDARPDGGITGLLAHYRGNGIDLMGSGRDLTPHSVALVADRFGVAGQAAGLTATSMSFLELVNDTVLPVGTAARSVSVWAQSTSTATEGIINWGSATAGQRFGLLLFGGHPYFVGEGQDLEAGPSVADGDWHHLAVTYDGSSVILYVDGAVAGSKSVTLNTTSQSLEIGRSTMDRTTQEWFTGSIDDVRLYDYVLTDVEVTALFHEGGS